MSVELGFETIGNATVTVFDSGKPILATDPWISGSPYFGSWAHKYEIPRIQKENILNAKYFWISHGHPDHLDIDSLNQIRKSKILIPDHYGERVYNDLKELNFDVQIIKSNCKMRLTKNISIRSFSDYNQDAALLIDIAEKDLIVNLNDGSLRGVKHNVVEQISKFKNRFMLRLVGAADADMVNLYDRNGKFLNHDYLSKNNYFGLIYSNLMQKYNCNYAIPFSSFHQYQREDSSHMNRYIRSIEDHMQGFDKKKGVMMPPFIIWDSQQESFKKIKPKLNQNKIKPAAEFGDNWSDELSKSDVKLIAQYFQKIKIIKHHIGVIHFNCGGKINSITISKSKNEILFEVPRNSLINAIKYKVFDDLLIGNFMKTTLINIKSLYPYFTPNVAKYSDNGGVFNQKEFNKYLKYYFDIAPSKYQFLKQRTIEEIEKSIRYRLQDTVLYESAKYIYKIFS